MPAASAQSAVRPTVKATKNTTRKKEEAAVLVAQPAASKQATGPPLQASAVPVSTAAKRGKKR